MIRSSLFTRTALGLAVTFGLTAGTLAVSTPAMAQEEQKKDKKKKEKPAAKMANSKEFVQAFIPLQATLKAGQDLKAKKASADEIKAALANGQTQLTAAEAMVKNPLDRLVVGQSGFTLGQLLSERALMARGLNNMLDSGQLEGANLDQVRFFVGSFAYEDNNYARAIETLGPVVSANYADDSAAELLGQAHFASGNPAAGLAAIDNAIKVRTAAGGKVPSRWLERAVRIAFEGKVNDQVNDWARKRIQYNPSNFNWISASQILRETSNYGDTETIDLSRLLFRAGVLNEKTQYTPREYVEYLQAATGRAGLLYPGEALKVAQAGIAIGALTTKDVFVSEVVAEANRRLAGDKASLAGLEKDARLPTAKPITVMASADVYLSYDMTAKAEEMYRIAITRPGVDMPRMLTRLGIALFDQGKYAEAIETFAKVEGPRKALAEMWAMQASAKQAAAAAPAPASAPTT